MATVLEGDVVVKTAMATVLVRAGVATVLFLVDLNIEDDSRADLDHAKQCVAAAVVATRLSWVVEPGNDVARCTGAMAHCNLLCAVKQRHQMGQVGLFSEHRSIGALKKVAPQKSDTLLHRDQSIPTQFS